MASSLACSDYGRSGNPVMAGARCAPKQMKWMVSFMTISTSRKTEITIRDKRIADAYRNGEIIRSIATREGLSCGHVSHILKQQNARVSPEEAYNRMRLAAFTPEANRKRAIARERPIAERFFEKIKYGDSSNDCWIWNGATDGVGYAQIRYNGRNSKASHVSLELHGQPRLKGLYALHSCDNPLCVNPLHLRWGTQKENAADAKERGRLNIDGLALGLSARLAR